MVALLRERGVEFTTWEGWELLDAYEAALGEQFGEVPGGRGTRERVKVVSRRAMTDISQGKDEVHEDLIGEMGEMVFLRPRAFLRTTRAGPRLRRSPRRRYAYPSLSQWPEDHCAFGGMWALLLAIGYAIALGTRQSMDFHLRRHRTHPNRLVLLELCDDGLVR